MHLSAVIITAVQLRSNNSATNVSLQEHSVVYQGNEGVYKVNVFLYFLLNSVCVVEVFGLLYC